MLKIKEALKKLAEKTGNFENDLEKLLQDLMNHAECLWDYRSIRYSAVMTKQEWEEFYKHPQRRPYKSAVLATIKESEQLKYIFEILSETYNYYKILKKSK